MPDTPWTPAQLTRRLGSWVGLAALLGTAAACAAPARVENGPEKSREAATPAIECTGGDCTDGAGTARAFGFEYDGAFVAGLPEGHGRATYPDGSSFEGRFVEGVPAGVGRLTLADGSSETGYRGARIEGIRDAAGLDQAAEIMLTRRDLNGLYQRSCAAVFPDLRSALETARDTWEAQNRARIQEAEKLAMQFDPTRQRQLAASMQRASERETQRIRETPTGLRGACRAQLNELTSRDFERLTPKAYRRLDRVIATRELASACGGRTPTDCFNRALRLESSPRRDSGESLRLYRLACDAEIAEACHNLGIAARDGLGMAANDAVARESFDRGCELGLASSCFNLGLLLRSAPGAPDSGTADGALRKACSLGYVAACESVETTPDPQR